jgi:hypothetical protein
MKNFWWVIDRLQAMGLREEPRRFRQAVSAELKHHGYGVVSIPPLLNMFGWHCPALSIHSFNLDYCGPAGRTMGGWVQIFGSNMKPLGLPPNWNCDLLKGTTAPLTFCKPHSYCEEPLAKKISYDGLITTRLATITAVESMTMEPPLHDDLGVFDEQK